MPSSEPLNEGLKALLYQKPDRETKYFDTRNSEFAELATVDIGRIYSNLSMLMMFGEMDWRRYEALSLFNEALASLVSAFRICREGSNRDALALVRISVEAAAVGSHVGLDQNGFMSYTRTAKPSYQTRRGIQFAKLNVDSRISQFIDNLASAATHPSRKGFGPEHDESGPVIHLGRYRSRTDDQIDGILYFISIGACFVLRAIEVSFVSGEAQNEFHPISTIHSMTIIAERLLDKRFESFSSHSQ